MKNFLLVLLIPFFFGCALPGGSINLAWRGTVHCTDLRADTDAQINNRPSQGDIAIAAEKTTDVQATTDVKRTSD